MTTPDHTNQFSLRPSAPLDDWAGRILSGEPRAVAQAITAVENADPVAPDLLRLLLPHTGRAVLIGITGAPGSGKSTLADALITELRRRGQAVGVLAVDPSSPFTGGALLGDRLRMQAHAQDTGVFIRSLATRGTLGGVASATFDAAMILDAAGKDIILIETVGAGQDEVDIARIADVALLLLTPGTGDGVQTFKAGLMEIADIFVLNKSDQPGAGQLEQHVREMSSGAVRAGSETPVVRTVATMGEGIEALVDAIFHFIDNARKTGSFDQRRQRSRSHRSTSGMTLDHLGIAVESLESIVQFYERALGLKVSGCETIATEKTQVAMLPLGNTRIELLEATEPDSVIARFLAKRGPGLHHICLRVPDLAAAVAYLKLAGAQLISETPGTGAGGHRYVFVHPSSTGGVLLELVES